MPKITNEIKITKLKKGWLLEIPSNELLPGFDMADFGDMIGKAIGGQDEIMQQINKAQADPHKALRNNSMQYFETTEHLCKFLCNEFEGIDDDEWKTPLKP
jgi:hypothetical protein